MAVRKFRVLFLCTGNACRSQMAEGWARHLWPDRLEAFSAGVSPSGLNADAVRVMAEAGVDISAQRSKHVDEFKGMPFDAVFTLCGEAQESCPRFPGKTKVIHKGFADPGKAAGSEDKVLAVFRRVRDEIRSFVQSLPELLEKEIPHA